MRERVIASARTTHAHIHITRRTHTHTDHTSHPPHNTPPHTAAMADPPSLLRQIDQLRQQLDEQARLTEAAQAQLAAMSSDDDTAASNSPTPAPVAAAASAAAASATAATDEEAKRQKKKAKKKKKRANEATKTGDGDDAAFKANRAKWVALAVSFVQAERPELLEEWRRATDSIA